MILFYIFQTLFFGCLGYLIGTKGKMDTEKARHQGWKEGYNKGIKDATNHRYILHSDDEIIS